MENKNIKLSLISSVIGIVCALGADFIMRYIKLEDFDRGMLTMWTYFAVSGLIYYTNKK